MTEAQGGAFHGGFPQPFHVARWRRAEEPLVLVVEMRGVRVAHAVAAASGVEILAEHEATRLLQPHPLLELQGLIAVTALKWWWKPETLIPSSLTMSSIRSGRSKSLWSRSWALIGSESQKVLLYSALPVLLVREH